MIILNCSPCWSNLFNGHPDWTVVETFLLDQHGVSFRYFASDVEILKEKGIKVVSYDAETGRTEPWNSSHITENYVYALEFESEEKELMFRLSYL